MRQILNKKNAYLTSTAYHLFSLTAYFDEKNPFWRVVPFEVFHVHKKGLLMYVASLTLLRNNSIRFFKARLEKVTCPKILSYNQGRTSRSMKVFQSDISLSSIRKKAERDPIGALVKFHHSRIKRLTTKLKKLE